MFERKGVKDAEFCRNNTTSYIAIPIHGTIQTIFLWGGSIEFSSKSLSEVELERVVKILSRKAKVMLKQRNLPPKYEELLRELKDTLEERYR